MAQLNYKAAPVSNGSNRRAVTRAAGVLSHSDGCAIVVQNTFNKDEILRDLGSIMRVIKEDMAAVSDPADLPTLGTVVE